MTEKTRSTLYRGLMDLVHDEQAVGELLSYFPARDVEEPVTKDFLRAELADLRTEMRTEMAGLRTDMERMVRSMQAWMVGTAVSLGGLVVATSAFLR